MGIIMTKERLNEYRQLAKEVEELKERIAILESRCEGGAIIITDMPKGGVPSDNLINLGDAVRQLVILENNLHCEMVAIEEYIEQIEDSRARTIFRYRYIQGLKWDLIAKKMNYSRIQVIRIHNRYYNRLKN